MGNTVRSDFDRVLAALLDEWEFGFVPHERPSGAACIEVSGSPRSPRVAVEARSPAWSRMEGDFPIVITDATAHHLRPAIEAVALAARREVRFIEVCYEPWHPEAVAHVFVKAAGFSRSRLLGPPTKSGKPQISEDGLSSLRRLVRVLRDVIETRLGGGKKVAVIAPKPVAEFLTAACAASTADTPPAVIDPAVAAMAAEIATALHSGTISEFRFGHFGATRGTNTMEDADVLLTMPCVPNIGQVAEEARALRVCPHEHLIGLTNAELEQAQHRLRQVRATPNKPRLIVHVDREAPSFWREPFQRIELPRGGPVPSAASGRLEQLAGAVAERLGALCAALLRWMAAHPDLAARLLTFDATPTEVGLSRSPVDHAAQVSEITALVPSASQKQLERAVAKALPDVQPVGVRDPTGGSRTWRLREIRPGAARDLCERLRTLINEQRQLQQQSNDEPTE